MNLLRYIINGREYRDYYEEISQGLAYAVMISSLAEYVLFQDYAENTIFEFKK